MLWGPSRCGASGGVPDQECGIGRRLANAAIAETSAADKSRRSACSASEATRVARCRPASTWAGSPCSVPSSAWLHLVLLAFFLWLSFLLAFLRLSFIFLHREELLKLHQLEVPVAQSVGVVDDHPVLYHLLAVVVHGGREMPTGRWLRERLLADAASEAIGAHLGWGSFHTRRSLLDNMALQTPLWSRIFESKNGQRRAPLWMVKCARPVPLGPRSCAQPSP